MQFEYDQTPLQRKIVVQHQIIKQMLDPRNKMFYSNEDLIKANRELETLNAEQESFAKMNSGGSKSKRYRRKSKSHRKYHMRSHKKSRKH